MANIPENDPTNAPKTDAGAASSRARSGSSQGASSSSSHRSRSRAGVRLDRRTIEALRRPTGVAGGNPGGRELNFFDVLNIFKRQIWIIILAAIIGMAVAGYYSQTVTPQYAAYSNIYVPQMNSMSLLNGVTRTNGTIQNLRGDTIETHALVIRSYEIVSKTWRDICENPEKRKLMVTIDPDDESMTETRAVGKLTGLISVRVGGEQRGFHDTNTIGVSCRSESPKEAAMIVNTVVDQYKQHFIERYTKSNEDVKAAMQPLYSTGGEERAGLGFTVMQSY